MTRIPVNPELLTWARERAGVIKSGESVGKSRTYARYLPFWA